MIHVLAGLGYWEYSRGALYQGCAIPKGHVTTPLTPRFLETGREQAQEPLVISKLWGCVFTSGDPLCPTHERPQPRHLASLFDLGRGGVFTASRKGKEATWSWRTESPAAVPRLRSQTEAADLEVGGERLESWPSQGKLRQLLEPEVERKKGVLKCLSTEHDSRNSNH